MASAMLRATVSVPAALQYGQGVCPQVPTSSVQVVQKNKPVCVVANYNCGLFSEERRILSRFSSQALGARGGRRQSSSVASSRAELAEDADNGNVIEVTSAEEMARQLQEAGDRMVVVDISTRTCGPCKLIYPKVVKMSIEYPEVLFLKINGDIDNGTRTLMREWGVKAVPNFRFFMNGKLIHSHSGAKEDELRAYFLTHYVKTLNVSAQ
ncbi:hypothetical protein Mapa_007065 [Marchantia paleacea]|nr:hypothetical protein Mapa_007065 [Marchantia paleacea]